MPRVSPKKLAFHDKLVGSSLSTDLPIKKLQVLHRELADLEQELVDANSLGVVRKELIHKTILLHKDRGVKAYAACCLADLLRLTAPDAPGLKGSYAPYHTEYFHLLESLSTVKNVVLVCDLPNADELMIEMFLSDIFVALIDECQVLPTEVLETIMTQFMNKSARLEQPAYRLAVQVCNSTVDKLMRHVSQYFTEIIVAERDDNLTDIKTAHELIKRLSHSCPTILPTVIPLLQEELQAEDLQLRLIVTQTGRALFRSPPEQRDAVEEALASKLFDPDDKLDYETALHHVKAEQLRAVAGRGLDKKHAVQVEALRALGKIYSLAYPEMFVFLVHFCTLMNSALVRETAKIRMAVRLDPP
ncbi:hypothetical protein DFH06DRAFT_1341826 [Mycena polygramma]|nr:hypothetical protein DFH06DRAFT_1341826 [Mycena polygramma]